MTTHRAIALFAALLAGTPAFADEPPAAAAAPAATAEAAAPADQWWQAIASHCGNAYEGKVVTDEPLDADFAAARLVMHVRRCGEERLEIPFHVGDDRSRTWVLTRTGEGVQLEHDHRHEDGSPDAVTMYGGHTADAGTAVAQSFPVDERSKAMFLANDLTASVTNTWTMEIVPGERFSYALRRPSGRYLQVDFDLTAPVEPPPVPWGHE